jgi:1,4-dihydroxy-2-naphthoate octaprenyltransferase
MNNWNGWLVAIRPKTLLLGISPVIVGAACALRDGVFAPGALILCANFAVSLQIAANLANDLYDGLRGVDTPGRLGPVRALQAGLLTARQLLMGMIAVMVVGLLCAMALASPLLGTICTIAAWAYTGLSFASRGLGELMALMFFGPIAVGGTYLAATGEVSSAAWFIGLAPGCLAAAVMLVNNLRDVVTDAAAGKRTLVVRIGERSGRALYITLVAAASSPMVWLGPWWARLFACIFFGWRAWIPLRTVVLGGRGTLLNQTLAQTAQLALVQAGLLTLLLLL